MKIKKGDNVVIVKGRDRGKTGRVIKAIPAEKRVVVDELNFVKKRIRPEKRGEKGKTLKVEAPLPVSRVKIVCPRCKKGVRVGWKMEEEEKKRICKNCGKEV